ncbi:hypothetical protein [Hyphomonas johnsonii]|uniref:CYTH domain-containing protein n=1 Tax=Hyphomonas johnsonii MHS-2 TaxID=1280950 RepID=A0A059FPA9_9PROT|nr:hypothetical protein [Hyphomonas johnsonii]KCZ92469.1 hypothetical protein HJO_10549 [Hyphomonas johnsonii MHS-2]
MTTKPPRYEFRCWPEDFDVHAARAAAQLDFDQTESRTDIYLLAPGRTDLTPKLRGGSVLELKARLGTRGVLERWHPVFSDAFPLDTDVLTLLAGLFPDVDARACTSPDALCAAIAGHADVRHVAKTRRKHVANGLRAEITEAACNGRVNRSIAFECEDASQLDAQLAALGLSGFANINYGAALRAPGLFGPA